MKVLLCGGNGQLGQALRQTLSGSDSGLELEAHGSETFNLTDSEQMARVFASAKPDLVVNASAYTAVDKAESEQEPAHAVNHHGVRALAELCRDQGARLIHVSTDFVFNGEQSTPYTIDAPCDPIGVYGESKRAGELAILELLPSTAVIIRTAWLYSAHGANFMNTMLRVMGQRDQLNVVYDQVGTPTCVDGLANLIARVAKDDGASGLLHWTDAGVASWYDFAVAIFEEASALGLLTKPVSIAAIPTVEYPTPAKRPAYSVLDKTESYQRYAMPMTHWRVQLRHVLGQLAQD